MFASAIIAFVTTWLAIKVLRITCSMHYHIGLVDVPNTRNMHAVLLMCFVDVKADINNSCYFTTFGSVHRHINNGLMDIGFSGVVLKV